MSKLFSFPEISLYVAYARSRVYWTGKYMTLWSKALYLKTKIRFSKNQQSVLLMKQRLKYGVEPCLAAVKANKANAYLTFRAELLPILIRS